MELMAPSTKLDTHIQLYLQVEENRLNTNYVKLVIGHANEILHNSFSKHLYTTLNNFSTVYMYIYVIIFKCIIDLMLSPRIERKATNMNFNICEGLSNSLFSLSLKLCHALLPTYRMLLLTTAQHSIPIV